MESVKVNIERIMYKINNNKRVLFKHLIPNKYHIEMNTPQLLKIKKVIGPEHLISQKIDFIIANKHLERKEISSRWNRGYHNKLQAKRNRERKK